MTTLYVFFRQVDKRVIPSGAPNLAYLPLHPYLLTSFLCSMLDSMTTPADIKAVFSSLAGRRVTATDIAEILDISRNSANGRLKNGLAAEDVIVIARGLQVNPIESLVELDKLSRDEVFAYLDGGDTLLASASTEQLVYRLAEDTLSNLEKVELGAAARALIEHDELAARRRRSTPATPPSVKPLSDDELAAAIEEANQLRGAAQNRTEELTEPESP